MSKVIDAGSVRLHPFSEPWHTEYLWMLVQQYKFNKSSRELFDHAIDRGKYFWYGRTRDNELAGVIYLSYHPDMDWWTLDAYREHHHPAGAKEMVAWSYDSGKAIIEFFFSHIKYDRLYTIHDLKNILATRMCERLGFKKCGTVNNLIGNYQLLVKARDGHGD